MSAYCLEWKKHEQIAQYGDWFNYILRVIMQVSCCIDIMTAEAEQGTEVSWTCYGFHVADQASTGCKLTSKAEHLWSWLGMHR